MICENCKAGADTAAMRRRLILVRSIGQDARDSLERVARYAHARCAGCDCQHRVQL